MNTFPFYIMRSEANANLELAFSTETEAEAYRATHDPEYTHLYLIDILCEADLEEYLEDYHGLFACNCID